MSHAHPPHANALDLLPIDTFDVAWQQRGSGVRLKAIERAAHQFRQQFAGGPHVLCVRTLPLARLIYPTKFALQGAAHSPVPFVALTHRALLVQFLQAGSVKTLLFNPSDVVAARATPFFAQLLATIPKPVVDLLSPKFPSLEDQLDTLGVAPSQVDYVAFDHFHTQDIRGLVGPRGLFPKARLLAPEIEWDDWLDLHPTQRAWYVAAGRDGVDPSSVVLTNGDLMIGDGVALLRTPGHTSGNQTLFLSTELGVWGCSENGTCADAYSPLDSKISGLRSHARTYGVDLVLNTNTPEFYADQYTSMILERTVVDRVAQAPAFVQMFASSEITASSLAPGLSPTWTHGGIQAGAVVRLS